MHATLSDIDHIAELCLKARTLSTTYNHLVEDWDRGMASLRAFITSPQSLVLYNGHGVLIAYAADSWWHDGMTISEVFFYAEKGGLSMLKEFMRWAKGFPGNNEIYIGSTFGGDKGERTDRLYKRLGIERAGTLYRVK